MARDAQILQIHIYFGVNADKILMKTFALRRRLKFFLKSCLFLMLFMLYMFIY